MHRSSFARVVALGACAALSAACSSSTVIRSNPPGAKVYLDGAYVGQTPYVMTDAKIIGSTTGVRLEKEGYKPYYAVITKNEEIDVVPLVAGVFLLVPLLWMMKYAETHTYDLTPESGFGAASGPPIPAGGLGVGPGPGHVPGQPLPGPGATRDPGRANQLNEEGKTLYQRGDYAAAVARFREAISLSPEARFYFNLCSALDKLNDFEGALAACGAVYTHEPSDELRRKTDEKVETIRARKKMREEGSPAVR